MVAGKTGWRGIRSGEIGVSGGRDDAGVLSIRAKPRRRGLRIADLERLEDRRNGARIDNGSALENDRESNGKR